MAFNLISLHIQLIDEFAFIRVCALKQAIAAETISRK